MTPQPDWDPDSTPTYADVVRSNEAAQELAQRAADDEPGRVEEIAKQAGETAARRVSRRSALLLLLVALLVPLLVSSLALSTAQSAATDAGTARSEAAVALQRLEEANTELAARGQPPVVPPAGGDAEEVSAAAITAQVLASLPPQPTAEQVAGLLRGAVVGQLQGPTFDELARLTAAYFRTIPAPPGPTEAQIRAAVEAEIAENPPRDGRDGVDGRDGLNGADGADGRSIVTGPAPMRAEDGTCVWRTTYDQPPLVEQYPAGNDACPDPPLLPTQPPPTG